jgi:hypothetical protein
MTFTFNKHIDTHTLNLQMSGVETSRSLNLKLFWRKRLLKMNLRTLNELNKTGNICIHTTLRRFARTFLPWESNKYYISGVCVCSLSYLECNVHYPCCHMYSVWFYRIFLHYLVRGTIFGNKIMELKFGVLTFSAQGVGGEAWGKETIGEAKT